MSDALIGKCREFFVNLLCLLVLAIVAAVLSLAYAIPWVLLTPAASHGLPRCFLPINQLGALSLAQAGNPWEQHEPCVRSLCGEVVDKRKVVGMMAVNGTIIKAIPEACDKVFATDKVTEKRAMHCGPWCEDVLGERAWYFTPWCGHLSATPLASEVWAVCGKVAMQQALAPLPGWFPWIVALVSIIPTCFYLACMKKEVPYQTQGPNNAVLTQDGPFDCFPYRQFAQLLNRIGVRGMASDLAVSRLQLCLMAPTVLSEPVLDVAQAVSFLMSGQQTFALLTILVVACSKDFFQIRGAQEWYFAYKLGHQTEGVVRHMMWEGLVEGSLAGMLAFIDVVNHWGYLSTSTRALRVLSIAQTVLLTLPNGSHAAWLLQTKVNFRNFYETEQMKSSANSRWMARFKWLASVHFLSASSLIAWGVARHTGIYALMSLTGTLLLMAPVIVVATGILGDAVVPPVCFGLGILACLLTWLQIWRWGW
mmetsp:Transcript_801/g.1645  ORF Transcript_801/g.1645 Transcript_801/m.1645 type:complete len:479 (+) Transcript_801:113-1549(+)